MRFRYWIAKIVYPEIFNTAHGLKMTVQELEQNSKNFKELLKRGKGTWINLDGTWNIKAEKTSDSPFDRMV